MAIKANIVIDQGSDFSSKVSLTDVSGAAFNLTGYTTAAQMRKNYASVGATTFNTSHNGANGQITLSLSKTITNTLAPGRYLYDVEITSSGNTTTRVVEGIVTVTPGMTRV